MTYVVTVLCFLHVLWVIQGFPGGSDWTEPTCNEGDLGSIPGLGTSGGGPGNPLQYSCLENPHGQRRLAGCSPWGLKESHMTEQLSIAHGWSSHNLTHLAASFFFFSVKLATILLPMIFLKYKSNHVITVFIKKGLSIIPGHFLLFSQDISKTKRLRKSNTVTTSAYYHFAAAAAAAAAAAKSLQSCPTLCDPIDGSPPGSAVPGILQARTLEWVAICFSNAWKWKVKVKSLSRVRPSATPWTAAFQALLSMGFARQEYWSGVPLPSPITILISP